MYVPPELQQWCGGLWSSQGGPGEILKVSHCARLLSLNEEGRREKKNSSDSFFSELLDWVQDIASVAAKLDCVTPIWHYFSMTEVIIEERWGIILLEE